MNHNIGPMGKLVCLYWKKCYTTHVWWFSWSGCSSPAANEFHVQANQTFLIYNVKEGTFSILARHDEQGQKKGKIKYISP